MSYFEDKMAWNKKLDEARKKLVLPEGASVVVTIKWPGQPERQLGVQGTGSYESQKLLTALWSSIEYTVALEMAGPMPLLDGAKL